MSHKPFHGQISFEHSLVQNATGVGWKIGNSEFTCVDCDGEYSGTGFKFISGPIHCAPQPTRVMEKSGADPTAHQWYAEKLAATGRQDETLREMRLAKELDPVSIAVGIVDGWIFYLGREYDRAVEQYRKTLEMDPSFPMGHVYLARALIQKEDFSGGIRECQAALSLSGNHPSHLVWLAYAKIGTRHYVCCIKLRRLRK